MGRGSSKAGGGGGSPATPKQTSDANKVLDKINNRKRSYTTTLADIHGAKVDANTVKGDVLTSTFTYNGKSTTYTYKKVGNDAWKETDNNVVAQWGNSSTSQVLFDLAFHGDIKLIPRK